MELPFEFADDVFERGEAGRMEKTEPPPGRKFCFDGLSVTIEKNSTYFQRAASGKSEFFRRGKEGLTGPEAAAISKEES